LLDNVDHVDHQESKVHLEYRDVWELSADQD